MVTSDSFSARLRGVFPALTTPFEGERVAPDRLAANLARYRPLGLAGFLVLGSTGESVALDEGEKLELVAAARAAAPPPAVLIAGVSMESTRATVRLARRAGEAGADGVLVLTPFFFRKHLHDEALVRHFLAVADASPVPLLLYNVPAFTGMALPPGVVERLAAHANVAGLKDSSGDIGYLLEVLDRVPDGFRAFCGAANALLPALAVGASGGILAAADFMPEPFVELVRRHESGDGSALAVQRSVLGAVRRVVGSLGVAGVKAAMDARGLAGGDPRPPLLPLDGEERRAVVIIVERLVAEGVLPSLAL